MTKEQELQEKERSKFLREFARSGGNASWKKRTAGMTKEEISEMMSKVRLSDRFKKAMFEEQKKY